MYKKLFGLSILPAVMLMGCAPLYVNSPQRPSPDGQWSASVIINYQYSEVAMLNEVSLECEDGQEATGPGADADVACDWLKKNMDSIFNYQEPDVCTLIYGGDQTFRVEGEIGGLAVNETLQRTNGCEIARWESWSPFIKAMTGKEFESITFID